MKKLLSLIVTLAMLTLVFCAFAEETPAAVFTEDFEAEAFNEETWTVIASEANESSWTIEDGKAVGRINAYADAYLVLNDVKLTDVAVEFDVTLVSGNAISVHVRMPENAGGQGYKFFFDQWDGLKIAKIPYEVILNRGSVTTGTLYHVRFSAKGTTLTADITDVAAEQSFTIAVDDETYTGDGYIGFCIFGINAVATIDNVQVFDLAE